MNKLIQLVKFVIDCRLLISMAAVGLSMSTFRILKLGLDWPVLAVIFFSALTAYNFPYYLKLRRFTFRWMLLSFLFCFIGIVSSYIIWTNTNQVVATVYGLLIFITLFYYIPLGFVGRLRELPYLKVFLISFIWTITTITLPLAYVHYNIFDSNVLWLFFERFLFLLAVTIPFDIRDLKKDQENGLITLPVSIGLKRSLYLSAVLLFAYLVISAVHLGLCNILFVRAICVFLVLILIQNIDLRKTNYYYTGFLDGSLIFQSILIQIMA